MYAQTDENAPDIHSSTDAYANRFSGALGAWLLDVQKAATTILINSSNTREVLDVGGGHAQNVETVLQAGGKLTVLGSDSSCSTRLKPYLTKEGTGVVFREGNLTDIPFDDNSFDLTISYRILAHIGNWNMLIQELCRVSRNSVLIDYPVWHSSNIMSKFTFNLKKSLEGNTRPYRVYHEREILTAFAAQGYELKAKIPQFFWPMAFHRLHRSPTMAKSMESIPKALGLTQLLGSPVIAHFEREQGRQ